MSRQRFRPYPPRWSESVSYDLAYHRTWFTLTDGAMTMSVALAAEHDDETLRQWAREWLRLEIECEWVALVAERFPARRRKYRRRQLARRRRG